MSMRGDFIGFTYNDVHSSDLGIVRVSDGSRFNENLLPTMQDKTAQVPGGDGTYYFGSFYTQKQIDIPYAFDSLTEEQLANLKRVFGDKQVHDLIFDEAPYKKYRAKVTGTAQIKYVPFGDGETVYKGEGTIQFTAYEPYARSVHKFLDEYEDANKDAWKEASGMLETQGDYDELNRVNDTIILYNPGVKESDFILTLGFSGENYIPGGTIRLDGGKFLTLSQMSRQGRDSHIKIDTKLGLIYGLEGDISTGMRTGTIYNQYITDGDFFKIPRHTSTENDLLMTIVQGPGESYDIAERVIGIDYDYYYY